MKYHDITKRDMKNGDGLRVVLWLSGCDHHCKNCHNPITWNSDDGIEFDESAKKEIFEKLDQPFISGITFTGGDPLHPSNIVEVEELMKEIKYKYPNKTIWLYTGFKYDEIMHMSILHYVDILVDGEFMEEYKDSKLQWKGSGNQWVLDIPETRQKKEVVFYNSH